MGEKPYGEDRPVVGTAGVVAGRRGSKIRIKKLSDNLYSFCCVSKRMLPARSCQKGKDSAVLWMATAGRKSSAVISRVKENVCRLIVSGGRCVFWIMRQ